MGQKHERLREEFELLFQDTFPESRIFKRIVSQLYLPNGVPIKVNMDGQADSWAIIKIKEYLIHLEIEYKIGKDRQSKEQKNWQGVVESLNGIYILVHDLGIHGLTPMQAIEKIKELLKC